MDIPHHDPTAASHAAPTKTGLRARFYSPLKTPLGHLACFIAMPLTGYWWWTYSGVYRWMAELQLVLFNWYEVTITVLLTIIPTAFAILLVLSPLASRGLLGEMWRMSRDEARMRGVAWETWLRARQGLLGLVMVAIMALAFGALMLAQEQRLKTLSTLTAAEAERGVLPSSDWVQVTGIPRYDLALEYTDNHMDRFCMPIVSESWVPGQPAAVFVDGFRSRNWQAKSGDQSVPFRGVRTIGGMTGMVREEYRAAGIIAGDNVLALSLDRKPGDFQLLSQILLIAGGVGLLAGSVAWWVSWRKHRRALEGISLQPMSMDWPPRS